MKQGHATRSGMASTKIEPRSHAVNVVAVSQLGAVQGNHVTDKGALPIKAEPLYKGRGIEAPMNHIATHKGGSQGRY